MVARALLLLQKGPESFQGGTASVTVAQAKHDTRSSGTLTVVSVPRGLGPVQRQISDLVAARFRNDRPEMLFIPLRNDPMNARQQGSMPTRRAGLLAARQPELAAR